MQWRVKRRNCVNMKVQIRKGKMIKVDNNKKINRHIIQEAYEIKEERQ